VIYIIVQFFFFFQAEDGIRDKLVTGVQTCALPIYCYRHDLSGVEGRIEDDAQVAGRPSRGDDVVDLRHHWRLERCRLYRRTNLRSEERRVGKELSTLGLEGVV